MSIVQKMAGKVNEDTYIIMKIISSTEHDYTINGRAMEGASKQNMNIVINNKLDDRAQHVKNNINTRSSYDTMILIWVDKNKLFSIYDQFFNTSTLWLTTAVHPLLLLFV